MKKKNLSTLLDAILGFSVGVLAASVLWILIWGSKQIFSLAPLLDIGKTIFVITAVPLIEETVKFIPLKIRALFKSHYVRAGLMVGLGFGLFEYFVFVSNVPTDYMIYLVRLPALIIHTFAGGLMGYFISKKKSLLGLVLAILTHGIENILQMYIF